MRATKEAQTQRHHRWPWRVWRNHLLLSIDEMQTRLCGLVRKKSMVVDGHASLPMSTGYSAYPPAYAMEVGTRAFVAFGFCLGSPAMGCALKKSSRRNTSGSVSLAQPMILSVNLTRGWTGGGAYTHRGPVVTAPTHRRG